jgi:hypothetical protein
MYKEIKITATLQTPIIFQGYMTFDALLGALLFERLQDVDKAHAAIPIQCDNSLFHASAAQLEIIDRGGLAIAANLRAQHDLDPDHIKKSKDGERLHRSLGLKRRRQFGAVLNKYKTTTASLISWDVVGDVEQIEDLLGGAFFIGKKRTAGFGEVTSWSITEDNASDGLIGPNGEPLRPIPVDRFEGDKSFPVIDTAWKPAYWNPENRAACYAPESAS